MADRDLVEAIRAALAVAGDPEVAARPQRYMKSALPYFGVASPRFKTETGPLLRAWRPASRLQWEGTVRALWDEATHREEWSSTCDQGPRAAKVSSASR